jgi:BirA family biotin operon repressor/biotin-[acetyl-CoA-carboxylase] ligase
MNLHELEEALVGLPLGAIRYYDQIGSTNTEAALWAEAGSPDLALVIADEQTDGRGRLDRKWFTPPGSALAFSVVLKHIGQAEAQRPVFKIRDINNALCPLIPVHLTALGALAVNQALRLEYGLSAQIKWPNDVLLERRKVAGVLVEAYWHGDQLATAILGIGINVTQSAIPPEGELIFPATCVEAALSRPVPRLELLRFILAQLLHWKEQLGKLEFLNTWEDQLAFRGEWVYLIPPTGGSTLQKRQAQVLGLDEQGYLKLRDRAGEIITLQSGEISLRLAGE